MSNGSKCVIIDFTLKNDYKKNPRFHEAACSRCTTLPLVQNERRHTNGPGRRPDSQIGPPRGVTSLQKGLERAGVTEHLLPLRLLLWMLHF